MAMPPSGNDIDAMARIMQAMNGTGPSLRDAPELATGPVGPAAHGAAGDHINPINDMQRLIQAMNEGVSLDTPPPSPTRQATPEVHSFGDHIDPNVNDMARILNIFKSDDSPTTRLQDRAFSDPRLREALVTETTNNGVRVGSWEINISETNGLKSYTVANIHTGEPIASDLTLYDAAKGLASALNEGQTINTPHVRKLLNAEGAYSRARQNAAEFRQSMALAESKKDSRKRAICEDRFNEALARAKEARSALSKLVS